MLYSDQYQTLAEIAIGLAGFSGIIITLQKKPAPEYAALRRARLGDLLFASLAVVFFSFLPTLIGSVTVDETTALRIAHFLYGCLHVYLISVFFRTAAGHAFDPSEWLLMPFVFAVLFAQFSAAFGFIPDYIDAAYLLSMVWMLFIAAFNFVLLLRDPEGSLDDSKKQG